MPTVLFNGAPREIPAARWADLLEAFDAELAPFGHVVTDVRFDGLDEPAFREPRVLGLALTGFATVEVETGTPASLMRRCLEEAAASIEPLCQGALAIAAAFRRLDLEEGSAGLAQLGDGISTLMAIAEAVGLGSKPPQSSDQASTSLAGGLTEAAGELARARQREDWSAVADILEQGVEPALRWWRPVFEAAAGDLRASG